MSGRPASFPVILRCPRTARASKDDGPNASGRSSFEARWRSHLRMTVYFVMRREGEAKLGMTKEVIARSESDEAIQGGVH